MPLYRNVKPVLSLSEAANTNQTGQTLAILPENCGTEGDESPTFAVFFDVTQNGGSSSPTTDVRLQTSHDGDTWITVASATQLTANGEVHELVELDKLGPFVRAVSVLGGGAKPNHTVKVVLASCSPFRLIVG